MSNNFNFFTEGMKNFMNPENLAQKIKGFPNMDMGNVSDTLKQNSQAFTEAGKVAAESAQAIMQRGTEIIQDNTSQIFNSMKKIASAGNPENAVSLQQEFVHNFVQQSVANAKEMLDMSSKAMMEVFEKMSSHTQSNISTVVAAVNKAQQQKA